MLEALFASGLRAACLEIFYDQVGEFGQFFFTGGKQVDRDRLYRLNPKFEVIVQQQFECDLNGIEGEEGDFSVTIAELKSQKEVQHQDAMEMVGAIRELAKTVHETGEKPMDLLRSAMLLNEMKNALIKGLGVGVVTVLLFKGMWFWITLSILLTLVLLVYGSMKVNEEFGDEESDVSEHSEGVNDANAN